MSRQEMISRCSQAKQREWFKLGRENFFKDWADLIIKDTRSE